jgi:hypothetical protein
VAIASQDASLAAALHSVPGAGIKAWLRRNRVPLVLALLVMVVLGPVVAPMSAQPASRLALTAALTERHTVDIGPYPHGIDFSTYQGHLRSDKGPGQPLYAVPAYALARIVGAESASHRRIAENLGLWFVTVWSATIPLAVLIALLFAECRRFASRRSALAVVLLFLFTTMLLPFGSVLFAHDLVALLAFGAWQLVNRRPVRPQRVALAGLLASAAVLIEYETAIVVAVLAGYLVVRHRPQIGAFLAGGVAPVVVLAWYQWRAFGAPWRTPAAFYSQRSGYHVPSPYDLWWMFGGGRGLWVGAPIAIVGIGAAIWLAFGARGELRDHAFVALAIFGPYLVLCAGWSGTRGLEQPGPRYLVPALPFLAVPLAALWKRVRVIAIPVSVIGAAVAAGGTWILVDVHHSYNLFEVYRAYFRDRMFNPTLWSMAFGSLGTVLYATSVAAVVGLLVHVVRARTDVRPRESEPLA